MLQDVAPQKHYAQFKPDNKEHMILCMWITQNS